MRGSIFSWAYLSFVYLLWTNLEKIYSDPLPIFKMDYLCLYWYVVRVLYVYQINIPYESIFSLLLWVAIWLLNGEVQKFLILMKSNVSLYSFVLCDSVVIIKKPLSVIGTYILIITLNVNGLNAPTKRHRLAEWIQKQDCIYAVYKRPTSDLGTHTDWKWGDGKRYSMQTEIKGKLE